MAGLLLVDLGLADYSLIHQRQLELVSLRQKGVLQQDLMLVVEHPAVFTLGRRGNRESLLVTEGFLQERGIALCQTERGGDITYHGPGQLVIYPILDLTALKLSLPRYVEILEEIMLALAARCGVFARRVPGKRGIWLGKEKLGSIGVAIRRGISYHGLALNVNLDLLPCRWINPCGLVGVEMTSISLQTGSTAATADLKASLAPIVKEILAVECGWISEEELYATAG